MAGRLWTPDGEVATREKDIIDLTRRDVMGLSWLHQFAEAQQINIFCKRCAQSIAGQNNDTPGQSHVGVRCGCREWRFKLG